MNDHDDMFLRISDVTKRTGLSRAAIYRMIAEGTFPRQVPIGTRAVGWRLSSVLEWMASPRDYHSERFEPRRPHYFSRRSNSTIA